MERSDGCAISLPARGAIRLPSAAAFVHVEATVIEQSFLHHSSGSRGTIYKAVEGRD